MKATYNIPCGNSETCYGCSSCAVACPARAIQMKPDENGFSVPVVDAGKCTRCGYCETVCPVLVDTAHGNYEQPLVYGVKNRDDEIRQNSSSGGAFYAVAETVLDCFQDAAVYGCAYDERIVAHHGRATDKDGMRRFMGSKYVQSDLGNTFQDVKRDLLEGRNVLFSGTPCQISGLKAFLGKSYDNLFTVDFVCDGVMSPLIFKEHIQYVEKKKQKSVSEYYNRSKRLGWGRHVEEVVFADGSRDFSSVLIQSYKTLFYSHKGLRNSCYSCRYCSLKREGDITLGDFWGIENVLPTFRDDLGVSLVLVNTEKGKRLLEMASNQMVREPVDFNNDAWKQRNLRKHTPQAEGYAEFWKTYHAGGYAALLRRYTYYNPVGYLKLMVKKLLGIKTNQ